MGHPINAYHFIRHVYYGWEYVSRHLPALIKGNNASAMLASLGRRKVNLDEYDINGAAAGIVRVFSDYRLDKTDLVKFGRIVTRMDNGRYIRSEASINRLDDTSK